MKEENNNGKLERFLDRFLVHRVSNFVKFLKTDNGIALFTILSLMAMMGHTAWVFDRISHDSGSFWSALLAAIFTFSIDSAILIFTLRGKKKEMRVFFGFQIVMNLFYYYETVDTWYEAIAAIFISVALPYAIHVFAKEVSEAIVKRNVEEQKSNEYNLLVKKFDLLLMEIEYIRKRNNEVDISIEQFKQDILETVNNLDFPTGSIEELEKKFEDNLITVTALRKQFKQLGEATEKHVSYLAENLLNKAEMGEAAFASLKRLRDITAPKNRGDIYDPIDNYQQDHMIENEPESTTTSV